MSSRAPLKTPQVHFDLIVVGSGPAGYMSAVRAAQLGKTVAIVEEEALGGTCLNWGCIPKKSLLKSAELYNNITRKAKHFGLNVKDISVDIKAMIDRSRSVVHSLGKGLEALMKKHHIHVFYGLASWVDKQNNQHCIEINPSHYHADAATQRIFASHVIWACGAKAQTLATLPLNHPRVWTSKQAMQVHALPSHMIVLGAGPIGMEFANFYSTLGVPVTVIERQERILPTEDSDISAYIKSFLEKRGVKFITHAVLDKASAHENGIKIELTAPEKEVIEGSHVLMAIGLEGALAHNSSLKNAGVTQEAIEQTVSTEWVGTEGLYIIGDMRRDKRKLPWLAHKASYEAWICVEHIFGASDEDRLRSQDVFEHHIPMCIYGIPSAARIGLTERELAASNRPFRVGKVDLKANGKCQASEETSGFVKVIIDPETKEILGAHAVGEPLLTESISVMIPAFAGELTAETYVQMMFPHPTTSELWQEACSYALGIPLH